MADIRDIPAEERDGLIYLKHPVSQAEKAFRRMACGIAWGDPREIDRNVAHSAIVLAGEAEDHVITVMRLYQEKEPMIRKKAIEFKDIFLVKRVYLPPDPAGQYEALVMEDGLQKYWPAPPYVDLFGRKVYRVQNPEEVWPSFRSRKLRASIIPHNPMLLGDFEAAAQLVEGLIAGRKVLIDLIMAPFLDNVRKKLFKERLSNVAYRAMVGVVWELYQTIRIPTAEQEPENPTWTPWYEGKRR